jgi:hypothetical protein
VNVKLAKDWTDSSGKKHTAGEMVDVDAATLAKLEAGGVVKEPDGGWPAPTGGWPAPTGGGGSTDGGWPAPTGGDDS